MLFKNTYTAIDRDMQRIEPGQHQAVRSDCKTPAEIAAKPWECREYLAAEQAMRETLVCNGQSGGDVP